MAVRLSCADRPVVPGLASPHPGRSDEDPRLCVPAFRLVCPSRLGRVPQRHGLQPRAPTSRTDTHARTPRLESHQVVNWATGTPRSAGSGRCMLSGRHTCTPGHLSVDVLGICGQEGRGLRHGKLNPLKNKGVHHPRLAEAASTSFHAVPVRPCRTRSLSGGPEQQSWTEPARPTTRCVSTGRSRSRSMSR